MRYYMLISQLLATEKKERIAQAEGENGLPRDPSGGHASEQPANVGAAKVGFIHGARTAVGC